MLPRDLGHFCLFVFKFSFAIRIISVSSRISFPICLSVLSMLCYGLCFAGLVHLGDEFVCVNLEVERLVGSSV